MAVTLEQATAVAQRAEPLDTKGIDDVARVMRLVGVRRHNVAKNIGKPRYAFNALQVWAAWSRRKFLQLMNMCACVCMFCSRRS